MVDDKGSYRCAMSSSTPDHDDILKAFKTSFSKPNQIKARTRANEKSDPCLGFKIGPNWGNNNVIPYSGINLTQEEKSLLTIGLLFRVPKLPFAGEVIT